MRRTRLWILFFGVVAVAAYVASRRYGDAPSPADPAAIGIGTRSRPAEEVSLVGRGEDAPVAPASGYAVHGSVQDENGRRVAGVRVLVFREPRVTNRGQNPRDRLFAAFPATSAQPQAEARVMTDGDGLWRIDTLDRRADYRVEARPAAPLVGSARDVKAGHGRHGPVVLLVQRGHTLRVRVVDGAGKGQPAVVAVRSPRAPFEGPSWGTYVHREGLKTASNGELLIPHLAAGPLWIDVSMPGRIQRRFPAHVPHADELVLSIFEPDGATVHGTVENADGERIAGAQVAVKLVSLRADQPPGGTGMATSDADGRWRIEGLPPVVLKHVAAKAEGYRAVRMRGGDRRLKPGEELEFAIVLRLGATLMGQVQDPEGRPLAGAQIQLRIYSADLGATHEATSDAEGRFELSGLTPGSMVVNTYLDGYYQATQQDGQVTREAPGEISLPYLDDGDHREVVIVLQPGLPVRGRVVDPEGRGVSGARVEAIGAMNPRVQLSPWSHHGHFDTNTSDDGSFAFAGLAPHEVWRFHAEAAGSSGDATLDAPLAAGDGSEVEIVIRPTASIAGRVVDGEGRGVAQAKLLLRNVRRSLSTENDGTFRIAGLSPGTHLLEVRDPWHASEIAEATPVELDWGQTVDGVLIEVASPFPIAGTFVDAAGAPVAYARLIFRTITPGGRAQALARTDAKGHFRIQVWGRNTYRAEHADLELPNRITPPDTAVELVLPADRRDAVTFRIVAPDGSPVPRSQVMIRSGQRTGVRGTRHDVEGGVLVVERHQLTPPVFVDVDRPRDALGKELNLRPYPLTEVDVSGAEVILELSHGRVLRGTVRTAEGEPVPEAVVYARPPGSQHGSGGRTDAAGRFEVLALPDGVLEASVGAGGKGSRFLPGEKIRIAPDQDEVHLVLVEGVALRVRVLAPNGDPVSGASVRIQAEREGRRWIRVGTTDDEGTCQVDGVARDALFSIIVRAAGQPDTKRDGVEYGSGAVTVRIEAGVAIEGEVVDEDGKAVVNAYVRVSGIDHRGVGKYAGTELDESAFVVPDLVPGRYEVIATAHGRFAPSKPIEVTAPAQGLRLVVRRVHALTGQATGSGLDRAVVTWWRGEAVTSNALDENGNFRFEKLADDPGSLYFLNEESGACALLENVRPSDAPFTVTLRPGGVIAGRVEGFAARGAKRVGLRFLRGPIRWGGEIQHDGTFERTCVPPGSWRVELRVNGDVVDSADVRPGRKDLVLRIPE